MKREFSLAEDLIMSTMVLEMRQSEPLIHLFGKTRLAALQLLLLNSDDSFYLREIARRLHISPGALQRELVALERVNLIHRDRHRFYSANVASPYFLPLREIMLVATAVSDNLVRALKSIPTPISCALVFGSFANGSATATSDVDLLVITENPWDMSELVQHLGPAQVALGREINPFLLDAADFRQRLKSQNPFLLRVLSQAKLFLIGDQNELDRLAEQRLAAAPPDHPAGNRRAARHRRT